MIQKINQDEIGNIGLFSRNNNYYYYDRERKKAICIGDGNNLEFLKKSFKPSNEQIGHFIDICAKDLLTDQKENISNIVKEIEPGARLKQREANIARLKAHCALGGAVGFTTIYVPFMIGIYSLGSFGVGYMGAALGLLACSAILAVGGPIGLGIAVAILVTALAYTSFLYATAKFLASYGEDIFINPIKSAFEKAAEFDESAFKLRSQAESWGTLVRMLKSVVSGLDSQKSIDSQNSSTEAAGRLDNIEAVVPVGKSPKLSSNLTLLGQRGNHQHKSENPEEGVEMQNVQKQPQR